MLGTSESIKNNLNLKYLCTREKHYEKHVPIIIPSYIF
jgi:hypothetical protein